MTTIDLPRPAQAPEPAPPVASDAFGRIEVRGIDFVPSEERHGRARELFAVWAASNVNYLYILLGGTLVLLGLDVWQAFAVVLAGNLFWALVGLLAVSGPVAGSPSSVVTRAMFGIRGNRVNVAIAGWLICVAYEAINLAVGALAGFAFVEQLGLSASLPVKLAIVVVTAAITLTISVFGHATIVKASGFFTVALTACMVVLGVYVVSHAHWGYVPDGAPHGSALWAAAFAGLTIIASGPLSWGTGADYARYLPAGTSPRAVAGWTAVGGFLPSVLLGGLGVLAGTAVDMTDPQVSLQAIVPSWFYPVFLLAIVAGSMTNNILTTYSSGLCLQSVGVQAKRSFTVLFDGAVGMAIACYALFVSDFIDTLSNLLALTVTLLGPVTAVYAADILMRRNAFDPSALHDETPASRHWYHRGVNWAGATAVLVGTGLALLCVDTTVFVGPVAGRLGGADLSAVVGPIVAAALYVGLTRALYPARRPVG